MRNTITPKEVLQEFQTFDLDKMSLILSTVDENAQPLTSYSPFVKRGEDYFICISSNLPHYHNMTQSKKAHVMIIEDESTASHVYARKRLYFEVTCSTEDKEEEIYTLFDTRYGEVLSFLKDMPDFKVLKLTPHIKSLVLGFGSAYMMDTDGNLCNKTIEHK